MPNLYQLHQTQSLPQRQRRKLVPCPWNQLRKLRQFIGRRQASGQTHTHDLTMETYAHTTLIVVFWISLTFKAELAAGYSCYTGVIESDVYGNIPLTSPIQLTIKECPSQPSSPPTERSHMTTKAATTRAATTIGASSGTTTGATTNSKSPTTMQAPTSTNNPVPTHDSKPQTTQNHATKATEIPNTMSHHGNQSASSSPQTRLPATTQQHPTTPPPKVNVSGPYTTSMQPPQNQTTPTTATPASTATTSNTSSFLSSVAAATLSPATSSPATSAPATSAPATTAPATTAPATMAPSTTAPATTAPATSAPATSAPATSAPAGGRRKRAVFESQQCMITRSFVGSSESKLTVNTSWQATFSCPSSIVSCNNSESISQVYCCSGNNCNSLPYFLQRTPVDFTTVNSCYVGKKDVSQMTCDSSNICVNITRSEGSTEYSCGSASSPENCQFDNMMKEGCYKRKVDGKNATVCCCAEDNCNKSPEESVDHHSKISARTSMIIGISVAFAIGLLIGIILTVIVCQRQQRLKMAQAGELLTFEYKRMRADEITEEILMT